MDTERRVGNGERDAVRLLLMIGELHKLGYQRLRIIPGMSPSGMDWRCAITASSNVTGPHGLEEGPADRLVARYSTGAGGKYFGRRDAERADPPGLARLFVVKFPEIAREAASDDWPYAGWFVNVLGLAESGFLPIAYSDFGTEVTDVPEVPAASGQEPIGSARSFRKASFRVISSPSKAKMSTPR